jgi:lipoyl(octanoyl) transferase
MVVAASRAARVPNGDQVMKMPAVWRVLDTGCADGATNMAIDEAILESCGVGETNPTLRLYRWQPACVSVGYFQSLDGEIRRERCREAGVQWVRRPTGGRLILHDAEVTYSVVASQDDPVVSGGIMESYHKISLGLREGLLALGVEAEMADPLAPEVSAAAKAKFGLCFDAAAAHELTVRGRKIAGSAQVRRHSVVLQHGSLLLDADVALMHRVLVIPDGLTLADFAADFARRVTTLRGEIGRAQAPNEVTAALRLGCARAWGVELVEGELTDEERAMTTELRAKYAGDEWNLMR